METHGLAGKMIAKMPKIARDCESPARIERRLELFYELSVTVLEAAAHSFSTSSL
jgi:hypothetical protein